MRLSAIGILLSSLLFFVCSSKKSNKNPFDPSQQSKNMDDFQFTFKTAHPKAQAIMTDTFFWSPIEETAPFGSDDGSDAAYGFRQWRQLNESSSPVTYLKELIASWHYPFFDYNEMDTAKIKEYIASKDHPDENEVKQKIELLKEAFKNSPETSMNKMNDEQIEDLVKRSSKELGGSFLLGQDNAIIGTGFAQFVLEGHIDNDIKALTITAIKRQLLPLLIDRYDSNYRLTRKEQLTKMLEVINSSD